MYKLYSSEYNDSKQHEYFYLECTNFNKSSQYKGRPSDRVREKNQSCAGFWRQIVQKMSIVLGLCGIAQCFCKQNRHLDQKNIIPNLSWFICLQLSHTAIQLLLTFLHSCSCKIP